MSSAMDHLTPEHESSERNKLVYEQVLFTPFDHLNATLARDVADATMDVRSELTTDETDETTLRIFAASDKRKAALQAAYFQGTHSLIGRYLQEHATHGIDVAAQGATEHAVSAIRQIQEHPTLADEFESYYAGLRWGHDSDRFINALFASGTDIDPATISTQLSSSRLVSVVYDLEMTEEITYDVYGKWYKEDAHVEEIFKKFPRLDPAQLNDESFRTSAEGIKLEAAYRAVVGGELAQKYKRAYEHKKDPDFVTPIIPLARFPMIESLMIDTVSVHRTKADYDFGPSDVSRIVLGSDSLSAQHSLVRSLTERSLDEDNRAFRSQDELRQKLNTINEIIDAFVDEKDSARKDEFQNQLLAILAAYQGDGAVATSVREVHERHESHGASYFPDTDELKKTIKTLMVTGLTSAHPEPFIRSYNVAHKPGTLRTTEETDPLALTKRDLIEITLKALKDIKSETNISTFENFAIEAFGNVEDAAVLRRIAELRLQGYDLFNMPEVHLARKALRKFSISRDDPEHQKYEAVTAPSSRLFEAASDQLNDFIFDQLRRYVSLPEADQIGASSSIAEHLVQYIRFGDAMNDYQLPPAYDVIKSFLEDDRTPSFLKTTLLWRFSEATKYSNEQVDPLYLDVVIDGYKAILGDIESLMIDHKTSTSLSALNSMAESHAVFRYASVEQIEQLNQYKVALTQHVARIKHGSLTDGSEHSASPEFDSVLFEAEYVLSTVEQLEALYERYQYMESVRAEPHVYYDWALRTMRPFFADLRREVGDGYTPSAELAELYAMIEDHVRNKFVYHEQDESYPDDFDIFKDGHIGSLIYESYKRMVPYSDLHYNNAVWQKGLPFVGEAVRHMPEASVETLKSLYVGRPEFIKYIDTVRKD